jgi:hypothetical protein
MAGQAAHCRVWLFLIKGRAQAPAGGACPPYGPGRPALTDGVVHVGAEQPEGHQRRRDNEAAHAEKAADAAEEQSPWRAANRGREAEPQAQECAKDHRRYEKWSADQ